MTSLNPSLRLALINKAKSKKNHLQKGFTLVELMVVVGIVGVLSAVALPNLLSNKDRAEAQTTVGSIKAFADQCNNNQQTENPSTIDVPAALITDNMTDDVCGTIAATGLFAPNATAVTFQNATPFAKPESLQGIRCGVNASGVAQTANGTTDATCTFTVPAGGGQITGAWS